jgi:hypothetical protein
MTRKLNDADRAAVDMLFDRINAASNGNGNGGNGNAGDGGYVSMTVAVPEERLTAVQRVLATLEAMPAPEPSPDLAVRTLQRVARAARGGAMPGTMATPPAPAPYIDPTQPMA